MKIDLSQIKVITVMFFTILIVVTSTGCTQQSTSNDAPPSAETQAILDKDLSELSAPKSDHSPKAPD
ncbi:hypothetical protein QSV37_08895 [Acinetobacter sp. VNK23]|uniref:hypothetical protein n=1 Tax=Acinetobacter thutiue TaxID=2998078 RepID=UPI00257547A6|nr:hypothetical protein [Acinetobacter thutiue]MDM1020417.1 hypothetical protein [Acinetobacter thutiue]